MRLAEERHGGPRTTTSLSPAGVLCAVTPYVGHMRHVTEPGGDTWGTLIRRHRQRLQKTQDDLAKALGVALKTVSRWENKGARPESYSTAVAAIKLLGIDPDEGLRLAGFGPDDSATPEPDPLAYIRAMGLDPHSRVVRRILGVPGISDEMRDALLRREREFQQRDEQRRVEELEFIVEQTRQREAG